MRRSRLTRLVAALALFALATFGAGDALARLSVIPGSPGVRPTPTPRATPTATPGGPVQGSVGACQAAIAAESGPLLAALRTALSGCLARGVDCLVDEGGSSACCEEAALLCQQDLIAIAGATRHFRESVRDGACAQVALDELVASDGLGFDLGACARLVPPVSVTDHASFADCLQLLMTKDVLHQVGLTDLPRAPEALVCMGLDDVLADALGADPATCEPTPTPVPTPTPDTPTPTATGGQVGPTPLATASPGEGGCQPALFGPCNASGFTACCSTKLGCIAVVSPSDGGGICVEATPTVTGTPAPTATPAATETAVGTTPSPAVTPSPGVTTTPAPTSSTGPTATPGATASPSGCTTLTATVRIAYDQAQFTDVAGVTVDLGYPASVSIPGFGNDASVLQRVTNLSGVSGIFSVGDQDTSINVGLVSLAAVIPPGDFASVVFDCSSGAALPVASDFSCTPDVSTTLGGSVPATCSVTVATP